MPCNTCGKDSGKFYEGSCPECLVGRVRELEIHNASLIGVVDNLIIEIRKLQIAGGELEASCAVMRDALNKWKLLAHFMNPPDDWRTGESLASLCQECILAGEQALSTTAGRDLLDRVEDAEASNNLILGRMERLQKEWQKAHPNATYWPDLGDNFEWLMEKLEWLEKLERVIGAIEGHDITLLRKKVNQLKGTDGEGWAVGEMLERALDG